MPLRDLISFVESIEGVKPSPIKKGMFSVKNNDPRRPGPCCQSFFFAIILYEIRKNCGPDGIFQNASRT